MSRLSKILLLVVVVASASTFLVGPAEAQEADETLVIALNEQNESGQSGVAVLKAVGAQTRVTLTLLSGALETELVHIHSGSCGDGLGGVVHGLTSFVGGAGGSVMMVDATLASLRSGDLAINSHQKDNPGVYTTCGNIPIEADSITIALDEQNASGQGGWASLTARGSATEVAFWMRLRQ